MPPKLNAPHDVVGKPKNTMAACVKFRVPDSLRCHLDPIFNLSKVATQRMLKKRFESSSKYYPEIPCVVSKSLIAKFQKNPKCRAVKNLVIPICGDKGRQIKIVNGGIRIPAIFKKEILPVIFPKEIDGFVRSVEFFKRKNVWYGSLCYDTPVQRIIETVGFIGVDRNSVGNVAVFADSVTNTVRKLGICPARTKAVMRGRRKNLQKARKFRLLKKLRLKQSRRMTHENHRASKSIVDYAAKHCRTVVIEDLSGVKSPDSKIRRYSEKNNWAYAQLETFLRYKCALRGIPIIVVSAAFTSQDCSRCGERHKPNGKVYRCGSCGQTSHRDVNAAFNIARRVSCIGDGSGVSNVAPLRRIGKAQAGKVGGL